MSPDTSVNIPVLRRLWPETEFDLHWVGHLPVLSTAFSSHLFAKSGVTEQAQRDDGGIRFCAMIRGFD